MTATASNDSSTGHLLSTSWFDSAGIASLSQLNVLDYFSQRSNPFYDRTCNNEVIKMQRVDPAQLIPLSHQVLQDHGQLYRDISYLQVSLHDWLREKAISNRKEPILYVIRKVHRQAPDRVSPLADYYVLGGIVYQCPDIWSIINSRLLSTLHLVSEAFTEFLSLARYNPNRGYHWEFPDDTAQKDPAATSQSRLDDPGESQRRRVDTLLNDLLKKFPPKAFAKKDGGRPLVSGEKMDKKPMMDPKFEGQAMAAGIKRQGTDAKIPDQKRKRT